ncbi:MAG: hypothetical protein ACLQBA_17015 [Candidatus Binataceae bacterium]
MYDVRPGHYTTVIREMIKHEDDVTNHRIMWLLVGQGFIANAYVLEHASIDIALPLAGILVALSGFVVLYKSYQARGYLQFLGERAKQGKLLEQDLPLIGWPSHRIKGWQRDVWRCPWFRQTPDLLEPWMFLTYLFVFGWLSGLLRSCTTLEIETLLITIAILSATILSAFCIVLVWFWRKGEEPAEKREPAVS